MIHSRFLLSIWVGVSVATSSLLADHWPQWRGPTGDGVSREVGVPISWSEQDGVRWKCQVPEWGTSTPAIWDDAVFLTSHVDNRQLLLLRIDRRSGEIEWTREVGTGTVEPEATARKSADKRGQQQFHRGHNLASPSPVTDGEIVVVHFGNGDLAAYDFDGQKIWHRNLQDDYGNYTIWWGHANSPVLHGDLVVSVCMQDSCHDIQDQLAPSYVVAHNKRSGIPVWKTMRMTGSTAEHCDSYTTAVLRRPAGQVELVVMGGEMLDAYDLNTGKRLWYMPEMKGNRVIPSPVIAHEMIYAVRGMRGPLVAVKPSGLEELPTTDIAWQFAQGTSDSPSPVVAGDLLLMVANNGISQCFNAHTGQRLWQQRLPGEYRASPVVTEGRVYFLNMQGLTSVISASDKFQILSQNQLDANTIASPAISDGSLFIRSRKSLYCIE